MVPSSESSLLRATTGLCTSSPPSLFIWRFYCTICVSEGSQCLFCTNKQRHIVTLACRGHLTPETRKRASDTTSSLPTSLPPSLPPSLGYRSPLSPLLSSLRRCHPRLSPAPPWLPLRTLVTALAAAFGSQQFTS